MNALLSVRLFSTGVIVAFAVLSPASLLFVPFGVAMVYADRILIRWSAAANRAYSIREMLIVECTAVATLCLVLWLFRLFAPSVGVMTALAPIAAVAAFRVGSAYFTGGITNPRK